MIVTEPLIAPAVTVSFAVPDSRATAMTLAPDVDDRLTTAGLLVCQVAAERSTPSAEAEAVSVIVWSTSGAADETDTARPTSASSKVGVCRGQAARPSSSASPSARAARRPKTAVAGSPGARVDGVRVTAER